MSNLFHRPAASLTLWVALLALAPACAADKAGGADEGSKSDEDDDAMDDTTTFNPADGGPGNEDTGGGGMGDGGEAPTDDGMMDGDSEGGFIMPPDGGVTGQCDPFQQDCPKGEKCTSYVSTPGGETVDATKCVPDTGNGVAGEPCVREAENDDCDAGFFCMTDVSGHTGDGFCLEYCDPQMMGPCEYGGECFAFNDGNLPVCEVTCDPLLQDCPMGQGCYAAFENFVCAQPGHPDGAGNDGDECFTVQGCQPGLLCRSGTDGCTEGAGCCTPICDLTGDGSECTNGNEECIAALDNPPPGLANAGYCGIPA